MSKCDVIVVSCPCIQSAFTKLAFGLNQVSEKPILDKTSYCEACDGRQVTSEEDLHTAGPTEEDGAQTET